MDIAEDKIKKINRIAADIVRVSKNSLIVNFRFLNTAMSMLKDTPYQGEIATNGRYIFYDPVYVLKLYKSSHEIVVRNYLHTILHCVFRHNIVNTLVDHDAWVLACDITVENIINAMKSNIVADPKEKQQCEVVSRIKENCKYVTA